MGYTEMVDGSTRESSVSVSYYCVSNIPRDTQYYVIVFALSWGSFASSHGATRACTDSAPQVSHSLGPHKYPEHAFHGHDVRGIFNYKTYEGHAAYFLFQVCTVETNNKALPSGSW